MKHFMWFVFFAALILQLYAFPSEDPAAAIANKTAPPKIADPLKGLNPLDLEKQKIQFLAAIFAAFQDFIKGIMKAFNPTSTAIPGADMLSKIPSLLNPAEMGKNIMDDVMKAMGAPDASKAPKANGTDPSTAHPSLLNPFDIGKNIMDDMMKSLGATDASKAPKDAKPANATAPAPPANATKPADTPSAPKAPKDVVHVVEDMGKNVFGGIATLFGG